MRNSVIGTILGFATEGITLWQKLLLYTEATKHQLIGGGIVGFLAGIALSSMVPVNLVSLIIAGVVALGSIAGFDLIVYGDKMFPGIALVLFILSFAIAASLSVLGTMAVERARGTKQSPANQQLES
jgi:hypothetical protein